METQEQDNIEELLAKAAELAASRGVSLDAFMSAAWRAFVEKHPGVLEQLEALHLCGHLQLLRMQGRMASA